MVEQNNSAHDQPKRRGSRRTGTGRGKGQRGLQASRRPEAPWPGVPRSITFSNHGGELKTWVTHDVENLPGTMAPDTLLVVFFRDYFPTTDIAEDARQRGVRRQGVAYVEIAEHDYRTFLLSEQARAASSDRAGEGDQEQQP